MVPGATSESAITVPSEPAHGPAEMMVMRVPDASPSRCTRPLEAGRGIRPHDRRDLLLDEAGTGL